MSKNGTVKNIVRRGEGFVGKIASGVGKFVGNVGNVVPNSMKQGMRMKYRKTRKSRRSRKSRK